jgi:cell division protein FtsN
VEQTPAAAPTQAPQALAAPDVAQVEPAVIAAVVPATLQPSPVVSSPLVPPPAVPVTAANSAPRAIIVKHSVAPAPVASTLNSSAAKARFVQIAAFLVEDQAVRAAAKLDSLGAHVFRGTSEGKTVFRVRLGPFANASEANSALAAAQMAGHADAMLVTDTAETQAPNAPAVRAPSLRMSQNGGAVGRD